MTQLIKYLNFESVLKTIIITFPLAFVIGNAFVNLYLIFFLIYFLFQFKKIYETYDKILIICPMLIWIYLVFISLLNNYPIVNDYNYVNSLKSLFYLRILILPVTLAYIINLYPNLRKNLFNTLIILITIISLDVTFQFNFGFNLIGLENTNYGMRNSSFFGSELISGSFISKFSTLVLAFMFMFMYQKPEKKKLIFYYFFYQS